MFDIEANGFLPDVTKVLCICAEDLDTGEKFSWGPDELEAALEKLYNADELIAHYGLSYDLPVLRKVLGWNPRPGTRRLDTVVISRLIHPNLRVDDQSNADFSAKDKGSHSLRNWGRRLGIHKGDYEGGFDEWNQEMQDYCEQDVSVTVALVRHLKPWEYPQAPLELEHRIALICDQMEQNGVLFDVKAAGELAATLAARKDELEKTLVAKFGDWQAFSDTFVPKKDNKKLGYVKGVPIDRYKTVVFNPGSRIHIEKKLRELGWVPEVFTPGGRAQLDEDILLKINIPEAKDIVSYLLVEKRLGQLQGGKNSWLKLVDEHGYLHPVYVPIGTKTHRMAHREPNVSQVPAVRYNAAKELLLGEAGGWGHECRQLFVAPKGWKLVGADMSGCQLRCLAHYIAYFDKGNYGKVLVESDIHVMHMEAAAPHIATRDNSKTTIYAYLFGAYDKKIGKIQGKGPEVGKKIRRALETKIPGLGKVSALFKATAAKGYLKGLDGRHVPIESEHKALNAGLMSAEAILCKTWIANAYDEMVAKWRYGYAGDFVYAISNHDELQVACKSELTEEVAEILIRHARAAGEPYGFKCPLDSKAKIGSNWAETH